MAMVLVVCIDVLQRKFLNAASALTPELEWHMFSLIFLLGAGYALKHDRHVRVDVFYSRFSKKGKALVDLLGTLFLLFPFCIVLAEASFAYVEFSYRFNEGSPDPGGLPARYLIKSAIPAGVILLGLQGLAVAFENLLVLMGQPVSEPQKTEG